MKRNILELAGVFACCFITTNSACAQSLTFAPTTYVSGNLNPICIVAADINGDGKPDLISVDSGSSMLTVMTNNGSGIFGSNATLTVGNGPFCVTAADINGDHKVDLISADLYSGTLTVYTNNGSGGFGFSATLPAGADPISVIAADLNGDGKVDLICANEFADTVTVLTNNGSGVFGSNATYNVGSEPVSIVAADLKGDGKMDLITANYGFSSGNTLTVLTNNGSGVFGSNATLVVGNGPECVIAADVNGDGKMDLISANSQDNTLTVLTNNGTGGFGTNTTLWEGLNPDCVVAADVNGDGKADLICANYNSDTLTVLTNNGSGVFGSNATYNVGISPISVVAADINGDGWPDLITANFGANSDVSTLTMLTNNGSGIFALYATITVDSQPDDNSEPDYIAAADVNNDGRPDLIISSLTGTLTVLINTMVFPTPLKLGTTFSGPNNLVLSWSSSATNIVVQTNSDLTGANWGTASYAISTTNGTNHSVTITPTPGHLFFRLKQ